MAVRLFALVTGLIYTALGIMGFFPGFLWEPELSRMRQQGFGVHPGFLSGFIPVNWPHNILWIVMGVGGLVACASYATSKMYAQGMFALCVVLALLGFTPLGVASVWGVLPLFGWNVLIHAFTAMLAWYYGVVYTYGKELRIAQ